VFGVLIDVKDVLADMFQQCVKLQVRIGKDDQPSAVVKFVGDGMLPKVLLELAEEDGGLGSGQHNVLI